MGGVVPLSSRLSVVAVRLKYVVSTLKMTAAKGTTMSACGTATAHTTIAVPTMVRHLSRLMSTPGSSSSSVSWSFEKTLSIAPIGVTSKNDFGARRTRAITAAWIEDAAPTMHAAKPTACAKPKKTVAPTSDA